MKTRIIFTIFLAFIFSHSELSAQQKSDKVYDEVDVKPEGINGNDALLITIIENVKYPEAAKNDKVQGKVLIEFIVDKQGNVVEPKIQRGIGAGCDEEALRVTKLLKFKPGVKNGEPVNAKMVLPFSFNLDSKKCGAEKS